MSSDLGTLERRLKRLERAQRLLLGLLMVVTFGLAAVAFAAVVQAVPTRAPMPQEVSESPVVVRELQLVDVEGRTRAVIEVTDAGPTFRLLDERGDDRVVLTHDAEQTGLFLQDGAGQIRVGVAQFAHGGGGVALHGEEGRGAAVLYLKGKGSLSFYDQQGEVIDRIPSVGSP